MDAHFSRRPRHPLGPRPPRERHRSLAAAVVEQIDVGAAEVSVTGAVDDVVDARLAESQPREVVEQVGRDLSVRGHAQDDSEGQPEDKEHEETEQVGLHEGVVPVERDGRLEAGVGACDADLGDDAEVESECEEAGESDAEDGDGRLVLEDAGASGGAVVGHEVVVELEGDDEGAHHPDGEGDKGDASLGEESVAGR